MCMHVHVALQLNYSNYKRKHEKINRMKYRKTQDGDLNYRPMGMDLIGWWVARNWNVEKVYCYIIAMSDSSHIQ